MKNEEITALLLALNQRQTEISLLQMSHAEHMQALECTLVLDPRAKTIFDLRLAEAHEANRERRGELESLLQILPLAKKTLEKVN